MLRKHCFAMLLASAMILTNTHVTLGSSTIYDGVVEKVDGDKVWIRVAHSPYSSVPVHSRILTHRDGKFAYEVHRLKDFATLYIDEVPVTAEEMKDVLRPGMRIVTMENRDVWYFLYVTPRSNENQIGFIRSVKDGKLILERPQIQASSLGVFQRDGGRKEEDGFVHLTFDNYPHRTTAVTIEPNAVVRRKGKEAPYARARLAADSADDHKDPRREGSAAGGGGWTQPTRGFAAKVLKQRNSVLVQARRDHMRVELIPRHYGDWKGLVNTIETKPGYPNKVEMKYQFLGVVTGRLRTEKIRVSPPHWDRIKVKPARVFPVYLVAGNYFTDRRRFLVPIYKKGEATIVDGFYTSDMPAWRDPNFARPGRMMVCFQRRTRISPDRFAFSSEDPVARGTIQSMEGNKITLAAPELENVPVSGKQTIELDANAECFFLGRPIDKAKALREGAIIHVYPKRPQTIVVGDG